jgi:hypothetical protein
MSLTNFAPSHPSIIESRPCPQCQTMMYLARLEPAEAGHDLRTFKCIGCDHEEQMVVQFESAPPTRERFGI